MSAAFTVVDNKAKTHLLESPICAGCLSLTLGLTCEDDYRILFPLCSLAMLEQLQ